MKQRLIDAIRPILPSIRSTPYGRRIQAKIQGIDSRVASGETTPTGEANGQLPLRAQAHQRNLSNASAGGYNPAAMGLNPVMGVYGQCGVGSGMRGNGAPPTTFPNSTQVATQGLGAHPGFQQAFDSLGKQRGGRGAGGNYF